MKGLLIVSALSIVVVISACKVAVDRTVEFAPTKPVVVQERISPIPVDTSDILYEGLMSKHSVGCFYQASKGLPYWFREGKLVPDGDSLINFIMRADHYGLRPDWYHLRSLTDDQWVDSAQSAKLRVELLLTDAFFTLSRHLKYGVRVQCRIPAIQQVRNY